MNDQVDTPTRAEARELLARAIYSSDWPNGTWEQRPEEEHAAYRHNADAVLAVLPTVLSAVLPPPDNQTAERNAQQDWRTRP